MEVVASQVKAVYVAAARLKMERVVNYCAQYLVDHLDPATAIEIRSLPGIQRNSELAARVDAYLAAEVDCLHQGQLLSTPFRIVFFSLSYLIVRPIDYERGYHQGLAQPAFGPGGGVGLFSRGDGSTRCQCNHPLQFGFGMDSSQLGTGSAQRRPADGQSRFVFLFN